MGHYTITPVGHQAKTSCRQDTTVVLALLHQRMPQHAEHCPRFQRPGLTNRGVSDPTDKSETASQKANRNKLMAAPFDDD